MKKLLPLLFSGLLLTLTLVTHRTVSDNSVITPRFSASACTWVQTNCGSGCSDNKDLYNCSNVGNVYVDQKTVGSNKDSDKKAQNVAPRNVTNVINNPTSNSSSGSQSQSQSSGSSNSNGKCDGWAENGSTHRNAGSGCTYKCNNGTWSAPISCDGQGNGIFQGDEAQNEEERRRQAEAVEQRNAEAEQKVQEQGAAETAALAEATRVQREQEAARQQAMVEAQRQAEVIQAQAQGASSETVSQINERYEQQAEQVAQAQGTDRGKDIVGSDNEDARTIAEHGYDPNSELATGVPATPPAATHVTQTLQINPDVQSKIDYLTSEIFRIEVKGCSTSICDANIQRLEQELQSLRKSPDLYIVTYAQQESSRLDRDISLYNQNRTTYEQLTKELIDIERTIARAQNNPLSPTYTSQGEQVRNRIDNLNQQLNLSSQSQHVLNVSNKQRVDEAVRDQLNTENRLLAQARQKAEEERERALLQTQLDGSVINRDVNQLPVIGAPKATAKEVIHQRNKERLEQEFQSQSEQEQFVPQEQLDQFTQNRLAETLINSITALNQDIIQLVERMLENLHKGEYQMAEMLQTEIDVLKIQRQSLTSQAKDDPKLSADTRDELTNKIKDLIEKNKIEISKQKAKKHTIPKESPLRAIYIEEYQQHLTQLQNVTSDPTKYNLEINTLNTLENKINSICPSENVTPACVEAREIMRNGTDIKVATQKLIAKNGVQTLQNFIKNVTNPIKTPENLLPYVSVEACEKAGWSECEIKKDEEGEEYAMPVITADFLDPNILTRFTSSFLSTISGTDKSAIELNPYQTLTRVEDAHCHSVFTNTKSHVLVNNQCYRVNEQSRIEDLKVEECISNDKYIRTFTGSNCIVTLLIDIETSSETPGDEESALAKNGARARLIPGNEDSFWQNIFSSIIQTLTSLNQNVTPDFNVDYISEAACFDAGWSECRRTKDPGDNTWVYVPTINATFRNYTFGLVNHPSGTEDTILNPHGNGYLVRLPDGRCNFHNNNNYVIENGKCYGPQSVLEEVLVEQNPDSTYVSSNFSTCPQDSSNRNYDCRCQKTNSSIYGPQITYINSGNCSGGYQLIVEVGPSETQLVENSDLQPQATVIHCPEASDGCTCRQQNSSSVIALTNYLRPGESCQEGYVVTQVRGERTEQQLCPNDQNGQGEPIIRHCRCSGGEYASPGEYCFPGSTVAVVTTTLSQRMDASEYQLFQEQLTPPSEIVENQVNCPLGSTLCTCVQVQSNIDGTRPRSIINPGQRCLSGQEITQISIAGTQIEREINDPGYTAVERAQYFIPALDSAWRSLWGDERTDAYETAIAEGRVYQQQLLNFPGLNIDGFQIIDPLHISMHTLGSAASECTRNSDGCADAFANAGSPIVILPTIPLVAQFTTTTAGLTTMLGLGIHETANNGIGAAECFLNGGNLRQCWRQTRDTIASAAFTFVDSYELANRLFPRPNQAFRLPYWYEDNLVIDEVVEINSNPIVGAYYFTNPSEGDIRNFIDQMGYASHAELIADGKTVAINESGFLTIVNDSPTLPLTLREVGLTATDTNPYFRVVDEDAKLAEIVNDINNSLPENPSLEEINRAIFNEVSAPFEETGTDIIRNNRYELVDPYRQGLRNARDEFRTSGQRGLFVETPEIRDTAPMLGDFYNPENPAAMCRENSVVACAVLTSRGYEPEVINISPRTSGSGYEHDVLAVTDTEGNRFILDPTNNGVLPFDEYILRYTEFIPEEYREGLYVRSGGNQFSPVESPINPPAE